MKDYFFLQYKMANRKLLELGMHPIVGYVVIISSLVLLTEFMFMKTEFAKYALILFALSFMFRIAKTDRTEFLTTVYGTAKMKMIRNVENLFISLPFLILLIVHAAYLEAFLLLIGTLILATFSFKTGASFTIPTPFYKNPFEFTVGFRNTFYIFPFVYVLIFIALSVDNLNLGIFAMLLFFLVSLTYHVKPENEYYVWSYSSSPSAFLFTKLRVASLYSLLLAFPAVIILSAFYPSEIPFILLFTLIGLVFLWVIILAKYSVYPNKMSLPESILIAFCIYFPLLLLLLLPYFYSKSLQKLKSILS